MGQNDGGDAFPQKGLPLILCAVVIYGLITLLIVALAAWFSQNFWMVGDTKIFYRMAEAIANGGTPYVDLKDPKPPLIFFTLTLPVILGQRLYGGLLLAGLCNLISALVVMQMGRKLYGNVPGFLAGLLFLVNMALAEGFFIITEPFTLAFILLSAYALLFMENDKKYFISGILAGLAIGFKQYALLMLPLALFFMHRNKALKRAPSFIAGMLLPLLIIFGAIFLFYGAAAGESSLYWSFGVADSYLTQGSMGDVPAYMAPSPGMALANVLLESGLFISLLALAAAGVVLCRPLSRHDEFFLLSGIAFMMLLFVRQYLHYWALALPFIILLCVRSLGRHAPLATAKTGRNTGHIAAAAIFFALVIAVFISVEYVLMSGLWRPFDILSYYGLAGPAAKAILGAIDLKAAPPPLLLSIALPPPIPWNMLIVGVLALASAIVVTAIGIGSYGRRAGLLAGLLFTANIAWALGYLTIPDTLTLAFALLSVYLIARPRSGIGYLASGLCAGIAACFGPLAIILAPVSAFILLRRKEPAGIPGFVAGAAVPIAAAIGLAFASYRAPGAALDSGLALAGVFVVGIPYRTADPILAIACIVLGVCLFTALVPMAVAGYALRKIRAPMDAYFLLAGSGFICSLLFKEYLHYWFVALPFMALLCASVFRDAPEDESIKNAAQMRQEAYLPGDNTVKFK